MQANFISMRQMLFSRSLKGSDCGGINLVDGGRAAVIVASKRDSTIML
jgi:hypothetical protein